MKKNIFFCIIISLITGLSSNAQIKELKLETLIINNNKPIKIFVTALWCVPCMAKYKLINKTFKEDTTSKNIILFDESGFSISKLSKIIPDYYDTLKTFFIPYKYYNSKGVVVFNLPKKALEKFVKDIKIKYPKNNGLKGFWYGDILTIFPDGTLSATRIKAN